ncbi:MAG: arginase [Bacteroidetes bacterium]|nr:arginase [Bacteroidota bacterium]
MKDIRIIEIRTDVGGGNPGAREGPEAIETAARQVGSRIFQIYKAEVITYEGDRSYESNGTPHAKHITDLYGVFEQVFSTIKKRIEEECMPIVFSGDHSSGGAIISGIKAALKDEEIGVIWIDAHADLHSPYTTPSGNIHGMPLAIALAEDNLEKQINIPKDKTVELWDKLKSIGNVMPKILHKNLVYIGVRDMEEQESYLIKKNNIRSFPVEEIRQKGIKAVVNEVLEVLSDCSRIFVSFDVDSLDPTISHGTGTPVPDGITIDEASELLRRLCMDEKLCCLEFTEVNPSMDKDHDMAGIALQLVEVCMNELTKQ